MTNLPIPDEPTFAAFTVTSASTGPFPITFSLFAKADLRVSVGGVELAQNQFTFSGTPIDSGYDGGSVTLNTAVASTDVLIWRDIAPARATDFAPATTVPVKSLDAALDRAMAIAQDLYRDASRALKLSFGATMGSLPDESRVGKYITFNAAGNPIYSTGTGADAGLRADVAASSGSSLIGFIQAGIGAVIRTVQAKLRDWPSVEDFGAVGDGVTDDRAAFQRAITAVLSGQIGTFTALKGPYAIGGVAGADGKPTGILIPYTNAETVQAPRVNIFSHSGVIFKALTNNMVMFRISDPFTQITGRPSVDANGKTGVWAFGLIPEDMAQTTQVVAQSYCYVSGRVKGCYAAVVMQGGPQVSTVDSANWYNVIDVRSEYCTIHRWTRPATTPSSVISNRNVYLGRANRCNVGAWEQGGNTNDDYTYFEGVIEGSAPFATPTAIVQQKTTGVPGSTLDSNTYYGTIEACTRWIQCDYSNTNLRHAILDESKCLFNERPQSIESYIVGKGYVKEADTVKGATRVVTMSVMAGDAVAVNDAVEVQGDFRNEGSVVVRLKSKTTGAPELRLDGPGIYAFISRYVGNTLKWSFGNLANGNDNCGFFKADGTLITEFTPLGLRQISQPPASAVAAGVAGTYAWDAGYLYICTAANTWKRVAVATW